MNCCKGCTTKLIGSVVAVVGTNLQITVTSPIITGFSASTKYCLVLTVPIPEAGEALPVTILFTGATTAIPIYKTIGQIVSFMTCNECTFGDQLFGIDLPERGRVRIPLYLNNNESGFYDLRGVEHLRKCGRR